MSRNRSYVHAEAITKSDTVDLAYAAEEVYVGGAGTVACVLLDESVVSITAVAGGRIPLQVRRINSTGTSATVMVSLHSGIKLSDATGAGH